MPSFSPIVLLSLLWWLSPCFDRAEKGDVKRFLSKFRRWREGLLLCRLLVVRGVVVRKLLFGDGITSLRPFGVSPFLRFSLLLLPRGNEPAASRESKLFCWGNFAFLVRRVCDRGDVNEFWVSHRAKLWLLFDGDMRDNLPSLPSLRLRSLLLPGGSKFERSIESTLLWWENLAFLVRPERLSDR